jgi:transposase
MDGLPVEGFAEEFAAALGVGRHPGTDPAPDLRGGMGAKAARLAIIISQSARRKKGGASLDRQGCDAGKKVAGRKRHILVDTLGLLLSVAVHPANVQDRDGGPRFWMNERGHSIILKIFADAAYQGARAAFAAARVGSWVLEIVKRTELHKFAVLPKRWRRADAGMDQPKSPTGARLRAPHVHCRRLHSARYDQVDAPATCEVHCLPVNPKSLGRLSEFTEYLSHVMDE